jgi:hypothetical protein
MQSQLQEIADRLDATVEEVLAFLDSPSGRRLRKRLATGLIISVPLIMRIPWLRRTPLGRLIEVGGGAALVMKLAELIRDWERDHGNTPQPRVIDVPPVPPV